MKLCKGTPKGVGGAWCCDTCGEYHMQGERPNICGTPVTHHSSREDYMRAMSEAGQTIVAQEKVYNPVTKPKHYNLNHKGIECIDAIEAALSPEEFRGYLKGNILKYTWREKYKNGLEDNEKSVWYANKLVEVTKNETSKLR